ncbi:methylenetetrahydrofolate reductase [Acetobacterium sp. K1/6]|uniref:methylenetetrahydrofolate reductase n=1 Tax=Acetobacterium sp. K1/6 TaxID=3055467 RepID=UPI002ACAD776|nr:methylenetetrahydrofolate reductase [Acetobacterium sp. K1/6]MDZ5723410.1 methylenetetrahydrofolate reductase [Acetobacterium sp. K1/6]
MKEVKKIVEVSFEISPMQNQQKVLNQKKMLTNLYELVPDYISCNINGIKDANFKRNFELCKTIKMDNRTVSMTNFSIGGKNKTELIDRLNAYLSIGIEHYFVIRGDFQYHQLRNDLFPQLFSFIETIKTKKATARVAIAGYPETHLYASSQESDISQLKLKQDFGADKIITQICFDPSAIAKWLVYCEKKGMHLPVDIGILPVINKKSVLQVCLLNGISIPQELSKIIGRYGDDSQEFKKAGIEYTIKQIESLKNLGIKSFHFFCGNNTKTISEIVNATGL